MTKNRLIACNDKEVSPHPMVHLFTLPGVINVTKCPFHKSESLLTVHELTMYVQKTYFLSVYIRIISLS